MIGLNCMPTDGVDVRQWDLNPQSHSSILLILEKTGYASLLRSLFATLPEPRCRIGMNPAGWPSSG